MEINIFLSKERGCESGCGDNSLGDFDPLGEQSTVVHHREACSAFKDHREGSFTIT